MFPIAIDINIMNSFLRLLTPQVLYLFLLYVYTYNKHIILTRYKSAIPNIMSTKTLSICYNIRLLLYYIIFNYFISIILTYIIICFVCKTLYLYVSSVYTVMWYAISMPSFISKYLIKDPLQKNVSTYSMLLGQSNPMYTSQYKLSAINTLFIVYPITGLNNVLYDHNTSNTKQSILCNSNDYAGKHGPSNRTDQSALNDIDPDLNDFRTDIRSLNTPFFDDQTFKEKF